MNIIIKTHHVNITGALKEYAEKKVEKILKYFDNIQYVTLELNIRDTADEDARQFVAGIVHVSQAALRAEDASRDMYASIDNVCEKLATQLKKHKEKLRDHTRKSTNRHIESSSDKTSKKTGPNVDDLYVAKPMDVDEAVDHLIEKKTPFFMFRNIQTEEINVVYPISSDQFGLIEP